MPIDDVSVLAVATGIVVIVVAVAVALIVLFVTLSMRGRQKRSAERSGERRRDLDRAVRAEGERDAAKRGQDPLGPGP
jgi:hypothetical protein